MLKDNPYLFPILLLLAVLLGGIVGAISPTPLPLLKIIGNTFLCILIILIVPLVFFSVASAVVRIFVAKRLFKLSLSMIFTFVFTGFIAAIFMLIVVKVFPLFASSNLSFSTLEFSHPRIKPEETIDTIWFCFHQFIAHINMLMVIGASLLVGVLASIFNFPHNFLVRSLNTGADVFMSLISLWMYVAPIGFFAYFAVLVNDLGSSFFNFYLRISCIYYISGILYFIFAFSFYAYLSGRWQGIRIFWSNILLPFITSLATCSSAASIPANLQAAKRMGVSPSIYETVIPLGAVIHKDGSVIGAVLKIAFLFGIYHLPLSGISTISSVIVVSILVGTVMGAIPSGGMLGELLIISYFGFAPETLFMIAAISILIDPLATMLNVTGDAVCAMMISRFLEGRQWIKIPTEDKLNELYS